MLSEHVVLGRDSGAEGEMHNPRDYAAPGNQSPAYPWPNSVVVMAAIAQATSRLRIVAGAMFTCHGLQKVWHFLGGAHDPRCFLELPQMPRGFRASLPLLRDLHLDSVTIVGVDYVQRSINLYFRPSHPSHRGAALLTHACERLGFAAPSATAQAHASRAGCIAFTYGWDAPKTSVTSPV